MQVSRKYLEQYFDLSQYSTLDLSNALTNAGFEVEQVKEYDFGDKLVVGEVKSCIDHPDSDHLHICQVDVGNQSLQIVCGASNVGVNQKVIVALNGCQLPEMKIVKSKVRGVESNGMLCSLVELGVSADTLSEAQTNGIEILDTLAIIGDSPLSYVGLDDTVFELGITPNRSDVVALNNLLKEVAAIVNQPINIQIPEVVNSSKSSGLKVDILTENAQYLSLQKVDGVHLGESNTEIQNILKANGLKPINNLVDFSNYVLLLTGQPNHIYDSRFVKGSLKVVDDYEGEFVALDGNTYHIVKGDLMIFDDEKPLGIAGIMGGEYSKVVEDTTDVIIEIANFSRMSIRNTSRRLNINSEASIKYQKNIDPLASEYASRYLIDLLVNEAHAQEVYHKVETAPKNIKATVIDLNVDALNRHLGTNFTDEEVLSVMKRLAFKIQDNHITIPTYRSDITCKEDLYEEVIRLIGYDRLPISLPKVNANNKQLPRIQKIQKFINEILTKNGINQALTYTLINDELDSLAINPTGDTIKLQAPLSDERKNIRRSILPSLLESVAYNETRSNKNIALYEISDVTSSHNSETRLAIVLSENLIQNLWNKTVLTADYYLMKSLLTALLNQLGFDQNRIFIKPLATNFALFHPYQAANIYLGKDLVGTFGMIHPSASKKFDVKSCVLAEINLSVLSNNKVSKIKYKPISKYQSITRDIAFIIDKEITYSTIKALILKTGKQLVKSLEVIDIYTGEHVEKDKKSMTIRLTLQADDMTLDTNTVNTLMENVGSALQKNHQAIIR